MAMGEPPGVGIKHYVAGAVACIIASVSAYYWHNNVVSHLISVHSPTPAFNEVFGRADRARTVSKSGQRKLL